MAIGTDADSFKAKLDEFHCAGNFDAALAMAEDVRSDLPDRAYRRKKANVLIRFERFEDALPEIECIDKESVGPP